MYIYIYIYMYIYIIAWSVCCPSYQSRSSLHSSSASARHGGPPPSPRVKLVHAFLPKKTIKIKIDNHRQRYMELYTYR